MVLKQCGQDAMTFFAPASLSVWTFCWASIEYTNSLPSRRAGSPVHASAGPRTAKVTPAVCSSSAMALVVFLARSSRAPAQPTQNRYSMSAGIFPSTTGTSKSSSVIHSRRLSSAMPHGLPRRSRLLSIVVASASGRRALDEVCTPTPTWGRRFFPAAVARAWSRRSRMTCLGLNGLPVAQAGHWDWQRPHSVQVPSPAGPRRAPGRSGAAARVLPAARRSGPPR